MEMLLALVVTVALAGRLVWRMTSAPEGSANGWRAEPVETVETDDLRSLDAAAEEETSHPVVAALLIALTVVVVAFGLAAAIYGAGRLVVDQFGRVLGL